MSERMTILKKVDPISFGVVYAIIHAALALVLLLLIIAFPEEPILSLMVSYPALFALAAPIVLLLVAIVAFIQGIVIALVYNLIAKYVGGVGIEIE
ncbi:MAG: hypothetical protein JRD89_16525 [Deltaproteobacteria bacterium]|nr:hypothetical protein [Deltaproteobacteria bacterium]